ncbi:MAG: hypothetical protein HY447_00730 [Candidatus Omnitrophica bacterium]|nr:hypothetical protein [Candidatus Omnitrophota bacterium]
MSETKQKVLRRLKWGFYSLEAVAWALRILTWLQIWSGPVGMDFIATGIFYSVLVFIGPFGLIRFSSLGLTKFYFWTKSFLKPSELKGFIKGGSMAVTLIPIGIGMAASLAIQALDMTAGEGIDLRKIALKVYRRALRKKENFKKAFRSVFDLEWARFIARNRFKIAYQILKYQSQYLGKEEFRIRYAELGDDTFDYLQGGKHFLFIGTEKAYEKLRDHRIPTRLKKGRWRIKDKTIDEKIKERFYVLDLIALKRALDGNQNLKPEAFIKPLFESEGERRSEVRGGRIVGWPKLKELLTAQSGSHEIVVNQGLNIIYRALGGVISKGVQAVEPTFSVEAEITGEESLVQVLVVRNDQTQELGIFNISGDNIKLVDSIKDSVIDFTLTQDPRGSPRLVVATTEGDSFFLTFGYPIKIRLYGFELSGELTPMRLSNEEYVLAAMRQHEIYRITEEGELFIPMSRNHGEVSYSLMDGSTRAEVRKAVDYTQSDRLDLTKLQIPAKLEPLLKRTDVPSAWIRWVLFAIDGKTGSDNVFFTEIPHKKWIDEHDLSRFAKWFETNGQTGLRGLWRPLDEIYRALPEKEQLRYESSYRNYLVQLDNLTINLIRSLDPKNVILADILDLTLEEGHQHIAGITIDNVFVIHFGLKDFFPTLETDAFEIPAIRFYKQNGRYGVYRGSLVEPPEIPEGIKWLEDGKPIKYEIKVSPTSKSGNIALVKKGSELIIASDIPGEVFVQLYFIKDAIKVPIKVQTMPRRNLALEYLKFAGILGWFLLSLYNINTGREALKEASEHPIYPLIQGLFWTWVLFAVVTPIAAYLKYKTIKSIRKGVTRAEVRESESSAVSHQSSVGKVLSAEDRRLKTEDSKRAEVLEGKEMDESLKAKAMSQESKALSAQELLKQLEEEYQYNLYQKAKARLSWQVTGTMFLVFFSIFVVQSGFKHVYEHYAFWVSYISLLYSLNGLAKNWFLSRRNNQIKSAIELLKQHSSDDALIKMISEQLLPKQSKPHRAEARQTDRRVNAESQAEVRQDLWRAEVRSGEGVGLPVELKTPEILALIELVKKESTAYRGAIQALMPSEASIRSNLDEARKQFEADLKQFHRFVSHPDFRRLSSGIGRPVDWSKVNWQKIIDELRAIDEDKGFKIIWGFSSAWNTAEDLGIHVLRPVEVWLDDRNLTHIASALFDKRLSGQDIADETRRFLDRIRHDKFLKRAVLDVLTSGGEAPPQKRITSLLAAYFGALKYGSEFYFANVIHGDERLRLIGLLASEVVKMMPERVIEEKASVDQLVGEPGEQAGEIVATVQKVPTHQDRVPEAPKSPPAPMIERAATSPVPKVERARTVYHITPSPNIDGTVEDLKKELASTQGARDIVLVFQELVKAIFQTHEVEVPNEKKPGTRKQPITIKFIKWHTTRSTDEGLKIPGEVILAISIERIGENTIGLRREGSAVLVSWKSTSEAVFNELMKKVRAYFKNLQSVEVTDYRFSSLKQLETLTVHPRSEVRGENRRSEARKEINLDLSFSVDSKWIYLGVGQRRFATPRQNVRQIGTRDFGQPEIFQVTDEGVGNLILDHDVSEFIHRAYSVLFNYYGFSKGASPTDMGKTLAITMGALTNPEVLSGVSLPLRITYETNRIIVTSNPVGQFMMDLNTGQGRYESRNLKAEHAFYVMWSELGYYLPVFIDERALTVFREQIKQAPRSLPNLLQALRKGYEHARSEARLPSGQVRKEEIIERGGVWKGSRKSLLQLKGEKLSQRLSGPQRAYTNDLLEQGKVSSLVQILPQNLAQQLPAETDQPLERSQKLTPLSQRTLTYPLLTGQETPGGNSSKVETLIPIEVRKVVEGPRDWVLPYRLGHSELKRAWDGFFATAYAATLDRGKFDQAKSIIGISSNASYAYILGPGFFIDDGGAAFFVQNVFGNSPAAVVIRNESDRANVDEVNMELIKAGRQPILIAGSVEEAQQKLHAYIASRSEVRAQSYSFMGIVSSFEPLAEKLMQALKDNIILMTRGIFKHFKELTGLDESVIAEWKARFQMAKSA